MSWFYYELSEYTDFLSISAAEFGFVGIESAQPFNTCQTNTII